MRRQHKRPGLQRSDPGPTCIQRRRIDRQ